MDYTFGVFLILHSKFLTERQKAFLFLFLFESLWVTLDPFLTFCREIPSFLQRLYSNSLLIFLFFSLFQNRLVTQQPGYLEEDALPPFPSAFFNGASALFNVVHRRVSSESSTEAQSLRQSIMQIIQERDSSEEKQHSGDSGHTNT